VLAIGLEGSYTIAIRSSGECIMMNAHHSFVEISNRFLVKLERHFSSNVACLVVVTCKI
jgi:hypothetical protein